MSYLTNAIVITLGLGVLGIGGYGTYALITKEPNAYVLNSNEAKSSISSYSETTKLGGIENNKKVLVANIKENKNWFNWSYKNLFIPKKKNNETEIDSSFSSIDKGYSNASTGEDTKALNKVCESFYKKASSDLSSDKDKKKNNIKWFCSIKRDQDIEIPSGN